MDNEKAFTVGQFLDVAEADDYFWISVFVKKNGRTYTLYDGYNNEILEELQELPVTDLYFDWADESVGITVDSKKVPDLLLEE